MITDSSYRESHKRSGKAVEYDSHFVGRHRALLWSQERAILLQIQSRFLGGRDYDYLDFACGTGRILAHMEPLARTSVGIDVSGEMLRQCRARVSNSTLIEADITTDRPLEGRRFHLITAFRFFLNAEPSLREAVMSELTRLLTDDGYLVFNNHMNRYSLVATALRLYGALFGRSVRTWTLAEIRGLVSRAGLEIVDIYHTGVIPGFERIMLVPRSVGAALETFFTRIGFLRHSAQIQIVVCRKRRSSAAA